MISEWGIKKFNLDDLYVRFFRLAERRIAEKSGKGIVCFVSNFSYLTDPSFVVMRKRFLSEFDQLWFDSMNGDSRETGKLTPEGKPDPSIFSTEYNREGIRVGTAIGLMARKEHRDPSSIVRFRQFWGTTKRADLLASIKLSDLNDRYSVAKPEKDNRFSFRPSAVIAHYKEWPKVDELSGRDPFNGPIERRANALIVNPYDRSNLDKLETYLDATKSNDEVRLLDPRLMKSSGEFNAEKAREALKGKVKFDATRIVRYPFKPFDVRLAYLDSEIQPLFSRPSPDLLDQRFPGNQFLIARETSNVDSTSPPFYFSSQVCDYHSLVVEAKHVPMRLVAYPNKKPSDQQTLIKGLTNTDSISANLSSPARAYLSARGIANFDSDAEAAALIWMHTLAIGYSPSYLEENADGIRGDWPRIPLPSSKEALLHSAELGRRVAALLDTERGVAGVTEGKIEKPLDTIGIISRLSGGQLHTVEDEPKGKISELRITAGWGHGGKGGITMPGKGKLIERDYTPEERKAIEEGAKRQGLSTAQMFAHIGERTCDVYLNDLAYWRNIPARVWNYTIGGYQVIKKWLSYREHKLTGRPLTTDEAREVMNIARRIAAILLLEPSLDANYQAIKAETYPWPSG